MIIFDLDGTLWDSGQSLADSWGLEITKLSGLDKHFTSEDIHKIMGLTMNEIADNLIPELPPERRYEIFRECEYCEIEYIREHGGELFPGIRETLTELKKRGYNMTIVSNCQEGYIPAFLDSMDMREFFTDYEEWGRTHLSKGENIRLVMERNNTTKAVYIGDIQRDADAAAAAGIPCIAADYGFGHIADPIARISEFEELPAVLEQMDF